MPHTVFQIGFCRGGGIRIRHTGGCHAGCLQVKPAAVDLDRPDGCRVGGQCDAEFPQQLRGHGAARHPSDGLSGRRAAAAAVVTEAVFGVEGVVCMAGPVTVRQIVVIRRALGGVADHHGDGRACGPPIEDAGEKLHLIRLPTLGGDGGAAGFSPVQISLNIHHLQWQSCRTAVHDDAQRRTVGFSPG